MYAYTLTVPLCDNNGRDRADVHRHLCAVFARRFGGWTSTDHVGGWFAPGADHPGTEPVRRYEILTAEQTDAFDDLAAWVASTMAQDAVLVIGPVPVPARFISAATSTRAA
jgi:hypothetical protein